MKNEQAPEQEDAGELLRKAMEEALEKDPDNPLIAAHLEALTPKP